jgi:phospholipase/lecithinase/hemolysin
MMKSMDKWTCRAAAGLAAGLLLALLASCGGGTEQIEPFEPKRYFAFGDEMSVLTEDVPLGRKYSVNALFSDGSGIDCAAGGSSLWVQILGSTFNFAFEQCNPAARPNIAFTYAAPGAKAADFEQQLAKAREEFGAFGCNDMMSVLIGANDVIDLYENVYLADPTSSTANTVANELTARGKRLGEAITALTNNNGPNIIVSTIPLMNLTPYARQQAVDRPNVNATNVLSQFSNAFNTALRTNIPNDGSRWGLVELDAMLQAAVNSPGTYGLTNVVNAMCDQATWNTADCTTNTLVSDDSVNSWLWASDRWIGWQAHSRLGSFARSRAEGNPFGCG